MFAENVQETIINKMVRENNISRNLREIISIAEHLTGFLPESEN